MTRFLSCTAGNVSFSGMDPNRAASAARDPGRAQTARPGPRLRSPDRTLPRPRDRDYAGAWALDFYGSYTRHEARRRVSFRADFTSWLVLCPDNRISGDTVHSVRTRQMKHLAAQACRLADHRGGESRPPAPRRVSAPGTGPRHQMLAGSVWVVRQRRKRPCVFGRARLVHVLPREGHRAERCRDRGANRRSAVPRVCVPVYGVTRRFVGAAGTPWSNSNSSAPMSGADPIGRTWPS
jgi:hypothetical protein